jgi:hypothetical protein
MPNLKWTVSTILLKFIGEKNTKQSIVNNNSKNSVFDKNYN